MSSGGKDFQAKEEGSTGIDMIHKTPTSSRQWRGFKNPRVVCLSRYFGGKDRHSKVCTVRGLRDRRIRLSVPTAIQLYDLQDRLDLSQPSKVVDCLLDANKEEIDNLPPLQIPPGTFSQFLPPSFVNSQEPNVSQSSSLFNQNPLFMKDGGTQPFLSEKEGIKINEHVTGDNEKMMGRLRTWVPDVALREKFKEVEEERLAGKGKWITKNEQENGQEGIGNYLAQVSAQNFFPIYNQSSFPGLINNNNMQFNSLYQWEDSNLSLSQCGSHGLSSQTEDSNSTNHRLPSFALPSGSQFCPETTSLVHPLPSSMTSSIESNDIPGYMNHFQLLSSSSHHISTNSFVPPLHHLINNSVMKSFAYDVNSKAFHSQDQIQSKQIKETMAPKAKLFLSSHDI